MKRFITVYFGVLLLGIAYILYSSSYPVVKTLGFLWGTDGLFFLFIALLSCLLGTAMEVLLYSMLKNKLTIKPLGRLLIHYVCAVVVYSSIIFYLAMLFTIT